MGELTKERAALFLAAQHCQGGHSEAGFAISKVLGVPFPIRTEALVAKLVEEGQDPHLYYPWFYRARAALAQEQSHER